GGDAGRARRAGGNHAVRGVADAGRIGCARARRVVPGADGLIGPTGRTRQVTASRTSAPTTHAHTRLASVPTMNRSRASGVASSEKRPMPLTATTTAIASG